jgi:hypothetical protein
LAETTAPSIDELQSLLANAYNRRGDALAQIGSLTDGPGPRDVATRKGRRFPSSLLTRRRLQAEGIAEVLDQVHTLLLQANSL